MLNAHHGESGRCSGTENDAWQLDERWGRVLVPKSIRELFISPRSYIMSITAARTPSNAEFDPPMSSQSILSHILYNIPRHIIANDLPFNSGRLQSLQEKMEFINAEWICWHISAGAGRLGKLELGPFISPVPIEGFIQDFILIFFLARRTQWALREKEFVSLVDGKILHMAGQIFRRQPDLPQRESKAERARLRDASMHTHTQKLYANDLAPPLSMQGGHKLC